MQKATSLNELMDAFDIRPLDNCDKIDRFYVNTSNARGEDSAAKLVYHLKTGQRSDKKILFMGHNGCGKSTELYKAGSMLSDEYFVLHYSISQYSDYLSLTYIDVIFSILRNLADAVDTHNLPINDSSIKSIYDYWNNETETLYESEEQAKIEAESGINLSLFNLLSNKIKFFLQSSAVVKNTVKEKVEPTVPHLIYKINEFLSVFEEALDGKKILLMIDDLDKIGLANAKELFIEHSKFLTAIKANIVYTFPISLFYSPEYHFIIGDFDSAILLSMIKVKNKNGSPYKEGIETLRDIISKRADLDLFENKVIDFIIEKSGGSIRNIFRMIREGAVTAALRRNSMTDETYKEDNDTISLPDVQKVYNFLKSEMVRCIRKEHIDTLKEIYETKQCLSEDSVMELLMCLAVIEYNGERWCDLNPAVMDYLVERKVLVINSENG